MQWGNNLRLLIIGAPMFLIIGAQCARASEPIANPPPSDKPSQPNIGAACHRPFSPQEAHQLHTLAEWADRTAPLVNTQKPCLYNPKNSADPGITLHTGPGNSNIHASNPANHVNSNASGGFLYSTKKGSNLSFTRVVGQYVFDHDAFPGNPGSDTCLYFLKSYALHFVEMGERLSFSDHVTPPKTGFMGLGIVDQYTCPGANSQGAEQIIVGYAPNPTNIEVEAFASPPRLYDVISVAVQVTVNGATGAVTQTPSLIDVTQNMSVTLPSINYPAGTKFGEVAIDTPIAYTGAAPNPAPDFSSSNKNGFWPMSNAMAVTSSNVTLQLGASYSTKGAVLAASSLQDTKASLTSVVGAFTYTVNTSAATSSSQFQQFYHFSGKTAIVPAARGQHPTALTDGLTH